MTKLNHYTFRFWGVLEGDTVARMYRDGVEMHGMVPCVKIDGKVKYFKQSPVQMIPAQMVDKNLRMVWEYDIVQDPESGRLQLVINKNGAFKFDNEHEPIDDLCKMYLVGNAYEDQRLYEEYRNQDIEEHDPNEDRDTVPDDVWSEIKDDAAYDYRH